MRGTHHIEIKNRDASFKFDLNRNLTIVRGNSGTGKTTLFEMVADYTRLKEASGVNISCDKSCVALIDTDWKNQLNSIFDSIVFIDEGAKYLKTKEFAESVKNSDNYYVIFNRESLQNLPYSVDEIYEIKASGKYHRFTKMFKSTKKGHIYHNGKNYGKLKYSAVLTEDSHSGFQFFKHYFDGSNIECFSSGSNSAVFKWLKEHENVKVLVIADGAAFGSQIDKVLKLRSASNFRLCLPESFEWLILNSELIKTSTITDVLKTPSEYIESSKYFSWEIFFEKYLIDNTVNTPFQYKKSEINSIYLIDINSNKIMREIYIEEIDKLP